MRTRSLFACLLALVSAACIEGRRVIHVNANGSGTIVETMKLSEQGAGMEAAFAQLDSKSAADKQAASEAKLKERAGLMGPGVRLVSLKKNAAGADEINYAFDNVNTLVVDMNLSSPGGSEAVAIKQPLRFNLAGKKLTITMPETKEEAAGAAAAPAKTAEQAAQEVTMMKGMPKGMKLSTLVEVPGTITTANVPSSGSTATIMSMDFDVMASDDENIKKFMAGASDPETMNAKKIQGVKGLSYPPGPQVVIDFK
jgi:hypothetical protein